MLNDRIEAKWIGAFARTFDLCKIGKGDAVAILSETQSREINVHLSELALERMGARSFHVRLPTPVQAVRLPVRSTGASDVIRGLAPVHRRVGPERHGGGLHGRRPDALRRTCRRS